MIRRGREIRNSRAATEHMAAKAGWPAAERTKTRRRPVRAEQREAATKQPKRSRENKVSVMKEESRAERVKAKQKKPGRGTAAAVRSQRRPKAAAKKGEASRPSKEETTPTMIGGRKGVSPQRRIW